MKHAGIYITGILLLVSYGHGEIFFQESYTQTALPEPSPNAKLVDGSLDFPFHQEIGNRICVQDHNQGIIYPADFFRDIEDASGTVYLSFCLRSLSDGNKDKYDYIQAIFHF